MWTLTVGKGSGKQPLGPELGVEGEFSRSEKAIRDLRIFERMSTLRNRRNRHIKVAFSGAPCSGKTSVVSTLEDWARPGVGLSHQRFLFNYNSGRKLLRELFPKLGENSFLQILRSCDEKRVFRFVNALVSLKREELEASRTVFTEKTLADYLKLLPMICELFRRTDSASRLQQEATKQVSRYDYIFLLSPPQKESHFVDLPGRPRMSLRELRTFHNALERYFRKYSKNLVIIPRYPTLEERVQRIIQEFPRTLQSGFAAQARNALLSSHRGRVTPRRKRPTILKQTARTLS